MNEKLKSFLLNDQLFYGIIVILVALMSFELGRATVTEITQNSPKNEVLSTVEPTRQMSTVAVPSETMTASVSTIAPTEGLVASKSGTKYHLLTCPGAKSIKEENKVYFASVVEAEAAGYKPAANCPQLQ